MKTSPENISLFHLCYFAIISTSSTLTKMANYPGTKLVGVAYNLRKKTKNSPLCVHVLQKTLNVVISLLLTGTLNRDDDDADANGT